MSWELRLQDFLTVNLVMQKLRRDMSDVTQLELWSAAVYGRSWQGEKKAWQNIAKLLAGWKLTKD